MWQHQAGTVLSSSSPYFPIPFSNPAQVPCEKRWAFLVFFQEHLHWAGDKQPVVVAEEREKEPSRNQWTPTGDKTFTKKLDQWVNG